MGAMAARGTPLLPARPRVLYTRAPCTCLCFVAATVVAAIMFVLPSSVTVPDAMLRASSQHPQPTARRLETGSVVRVACVGASITEGTRGLSTSRGPYPDQLATLLGSGYEVKNFGKGDRSVLKSFHMIATHDTSSYWSDPMFKEATDYNPDIVIFQFGADDTKFPEPFSAHYEMDYGSLAQAFMNLPSKPRVIIMTPPPVYKGWGIADKWLIRRDVANGLATHLGAVTEANRLEPPVGVFFAFEQRCPELNGSCPWLMHEDGLHPNYQGYKIIAMLLYIRIKSTGPGCPSYNESNLRCNEVLPQDRQAITAAHCKSLGCCTHDGSEMQWCDWATSTHTTTTETATSTTTTTTQTLVTTITNTTTTITNTTTEPLVAVDVSTTNMSSQDETNAVSTTPAESSHLTSSRLTVLTSRGTTAAAVPSISSSLATRRVASTTTTTTGTTASAHMVLSGEQGFALTNPRGSGYSTTSGPVVLARNISPDTITFFGPCSVIFAMVALISVWCYRSKVASTSGNRYIGVPHGSVAICMRPGCEKPTWNGRARQYCSHRCRKAADSKKTMREGGGNPPGPPQSTLSGSQAPLLSEATVSDCHADEGNRCLTPGCSNPTWNGQPGFCSAECYDELEHEQQGAKASAPPPDCMRPGCGKPTWNGQPDEYCSMPCQQSLVKDAVCLRPGCANPTWNGRANEFCSRGCQDAFESS